MVYSVKIFGTTVEWTRKFKEAEQAFKDSGARDKALFEINLATGHAKRLR